MIKPYMFVLLQRYSEKYEVFCEICLETLGEPVFKRFCYALRRFSFKII